MMTTEQIERLHQLGVDTEQYAEEIERDESGCNCDLDAQCFNLACREEQQAEMERMFRQFQREAPAERARKEWYEDTGQEFIPKHMNPTYYRHYVKPE